MFVSIQKAVSKEECEFTVVADEAVDVQDAYACDRAAAVPAAVVAVTLLG